MEEDREGIAAEMNENRKWEGRENKREQSMRENGVWKRSEWMRTENEWEQRKKNRGKKENREWKRTENEIEQNERE